MRFIPFGLIVIGSIYFLDYTIRAWQVCSNIDNWYLVNSYTATAMGGMWLMAIGSIWLLLTKGNK